MHIPAILLDDVSKKFDDFAAVSSLSFEVRQGDIYGFLGPNGSGKSTTLRMIMALIQPTSGNIQLFGQSLSKHRGELMRRIGCMIEKPDFYNYLSAKENLKLTARAHQLNFSNTQYDDLFTLVGLRGRESDKVKTFSHGMKQRLGLAQVLIHDPELIILDEPNTGLDPQGIIDLRQLMLRLNQERGKTILFSSHILNEVQSICTSMVVIHKGKAVVQGNVQDLLSQERLSVKVEVLDDEACINVLKETSWLEKLEHHKGKLLEFRMNRSGIPELIDYLAANHIQIERVDFRNQLEDYFLKITSN